MKREGRKEEHCAIAHKNVFEPTCMCVFVCLYAMVLVM